MYLRDEKNLKSGKIAFRWNMWLLDLKMQWKRLQIIEQADQIRRSAWDFLPKSKEEIKELKIMIEKIKDPDDSISVFNRKFFLKG